MQVLTEGVTTWAYAYDPNGNIKKIVENGRARHLEFDVGDRVTQYGDLSYKYDDDGLTAQRGRDNVAFNSLGQLTSLTRAFPRSALAFRYSVTGRLATVTTSGGGVTQFFYGDPQVGS